MTRLLLAAIMLMALLAGCAGAPVASPARPLSRVFLTTPIVENALDFLYFAIAERGGLEAWFCLRGFVDPRNQNTVIQNISPVFVDSADGANIIGRPADCAHGSDATQIIGTVHFHPDMNQCAFSDTDLVTAHYLPYAVTAIVCRDAANPRPHLRLAFRAEFDSAYREIRKTWGDSTTRYGGTFVPVYRFLKPSGA